ncbi:hypothetical protein WH221_02295 [Chryseobacterium culicis]|uniref:Uncharacterized protein n=1 Tax=Chryseobacterium culicis TaxID=680127 RepID=A0A2S9CX59_CHRCI|nr:hypothetical protein [Chryseobacterium culicis]PRB85107.1 hypothetical protein CQ022_02240 [Chryseobacterium culicis]PRB91169.1 hypothetical protein CQ033_10750 [Chryseobacterium culicis]
MYEEILKNKIQIGNILIYKYWRPIGDEENRYEERQVTISSVEEDGVCIEEFELYNDINSDTIIPLSMFKPIVVSIELLGEIGIEEDKETHNELFNEQWQLFKYKNLKFAIQFAAVYKYKEVFDPSLERNKIVVYGNFLRYIHEIQNILND